MKPGPDGDKLRVLHILESAQRIQEYVRGLDAERFAADRLRQDAVVRNFEIIGEAAKLVSEDLKRAAPDVPWRKLAGFRDVLIHRYEQVVPAEVWNATHGELDRVVEKLRALARARGWA